jgi:hypothetical protein
MFEISCELVSKVYLGSTSKQWSRQKLVLRGSVMLLF